MNRLATIADRIDRSVDLLGHALSWLIGLTVVTCAAVAVLRYTLGVGWGWMQDLYLWANAVAFMMAAGPAFLLGRHVRVDFLYGAFSLRGKARVDLYGTLFLLFPTVIAIAWLCYPYVLDSWKRWEGTLNVGGMPGVYLIKSVLVLFCIPLAAHGVSMVIRSYLSLHGTSNDKENDQ
ncbi:TRAP transporter small permease subunit [Pararhodobacter oceanensis]|uniref:TRAP transporter small permease protein n=1 Tax=Pararhodobacter oceanensis TaxID=2172121 RepID=A0A2T8HSP6_9RHOB|nr:TRAP transporter small permease subunit [Pararhodobacter oceanensis]PVH28446.1 C4-dicarboxylate ABC transporter permease [Pararhodobacter oceanensis]